MKDGPSCRLRGGVGPRVGVGFSGFCVAADDCQAVVAWSLAVVRWFCMVPGVCCVVADGHGLRIAGKCMIINT